MNGILITADSTFDLPMTLVQQYDIKVLPSYVRMGDSNYDDYPNLRQEALFEYYERSGELPQTAAANPSDYVEFFGRFANDCDAIIHVAKSSGMSGCYNNATLASSSFSNVMVIDSQNVSGGSALLAIEASEQKHDKSLKDIVLGLCRYRERIDGSFMIENLEYLFKGGRCSSLSFCGANILNLKPCIVIRDGKMSVGKKYRGSYANCLLHYVDDKPENISQISQRDLFIAHSIRDTSLLDKIHRHILTKCIFERIIISPVGAAVACHCGPNTFGMFMIKRLPSPAVPK